jgi:hypothetical protein
LNKDHLSKVPLDTASEKKEVYITKEEKCEA